MNPPISTWVTAPPTPTPLSPPAAARHQQASWMPWTGRHRLATPAEETAFVAELGELAGDEPVPIRRSDATAVLNALRCGLTVDELFEQAPGLRADRLHTAYCELERRRVEACVAWSTITIAGRIDVYDEYRVAAGKLLPALITRLDEVVRSSPGEFDLVLLQLAAAVASTNAAARRIERVIEASAGATERSIELGRVLYNHGGEGVAGRPDFLAHRVGILVPTRVAALLDEPATEAGSCSRARRR